ncbi:probable protein phosphatase 2C 38 [Andrographis paniculata]|uniref:probable protein phosphatase 2C 38 n=1 Tax=Andrographis paniculata TaxID=175694 RepID=UPI0021E81FB7|nr:probable protein phosphatase 2C 38 [Andrographis paniculata]XP_051120184.1 probable protein phosphatase 2C 38 [Andrographis paniculata]
MVRLGWKNFMSPCWGVTGSSVDVTGSHGCSIKAGDEKGRSEGLFWYKDMGYHSHGEYSMAVVQANNVLEDQSQIESGLLGSTNGTFVGIYDGHAGPEASRFINYSLFENVKKITSECQEVSSDVIKNAYLATEEEFLSTVKQKWETKPHLASVGSCCLVGIVCNGLVYVGNAGDSRVVLGKKEGVTKPIKAIQLSTEHNASLQSIRDELHSLHPEDPQIVVLKHNVWRVKGIIQVSRSIGDAYLKKPEFNKAPLLPRFRFPGHFQEPILSAEPSVHVHKIHPDDQFLIFASDGLWEHLSNQEAVELVHSSPHSGIAKNLIQAALHAAAKKREMRYSDLRKIDRGVRRHFHDDITVIVLFLNSHFINRSSSSKRPVRTIAAGDDSYI